MFAAILFIPLFMQTVIGVSATQSGSLLTPMMVIWSVGSIGAGQIVARMGRYKALVLFGLAIMTIGLLLLGRMGAGTTRLTVVGDMLLVGAGMGLTMPIFTLIVQNAAPQRQIGAATATVQFFRQIGGTVGAAVFGSIMLSRYKTHFDGAVPPGTPATALNAFKNPLQLAQVLPQLQGSVRRLPERRTTAANAARQHEGRTRLRDHRRLPDRYDPFPRRLRHQLLAEGPPITRFLRAAGNRDRRGRHCRSRNAPRRARP